MIQRMGTQRIEWKIIPYIKSFTLKNECFIFYFQKGFLSVHSMQLHSTSSVSVKYVDLTSVHIALHSVLPLLTCLKLYSWLFH